jgi:AbiV family abortive infection protein
VTSEKPKTPTPYCGELGPAQAPNAIQAARLNAVDLLDTADILFTVKRFLHAMAFATLAREEIFKVGIIPQIFHKTANRTCPQCSRRTSVAAW